MSAPRLALSGLFMLVALALAGPAVAASLVANGSLEDSSGNFVSSSCNYMALSAGSTTIPGWTVAPATTGALVWAKTPTCDAQSASDATFFVDLSGYGNSSPNGAIRQQLTGMTPNAQYLFSFDVYTFNDGAINVKIGNQPPLTLNAGVPFTVGNTSWTPKSATFTAVNATDTLTIMNATPGAEFVFLDHIIVEKACGQTATCDGGCPSGQDCIPDPVGCHCQVIPCDQSLPSQCGGVCRDGQTCSLNPAGTACGCVDLPPPCDESSPPQCGGYCPMGGTCLQVVAGGPCTCVGLACGQICPGDCPAGQQCQTDPTGCHCAPVVVPCQDSQPQCDGICPEGQHCIDVPGGCICHDKPPCAGSQPPMCAGNCADGQECVADAVGCHCQDILTPCDQDPDPTSCKGECPAGKHCESDPLTPRCVCHDDPTGCSAAVAPECRADCPTGEVCRTTAAGDACACQAPSPCEDQQSGGQCNGPCPEHQVCTQGPVPGPCLCVDLPQCSGAAAPECNGICPEGARCVAGPPGAPCFCEDPPPCEESHYPSCGGTCPKNHICAGIPKHGPCGCIEVIVACEQTDAPFCGGFCPPGSTCGVFPDGVCGCMHDPPPPCQQAGAPTCNGYCPSDSTCTVFHNSCVCIGCVSTDPGTVGGVIWTSKTRMEWDPEACSLVYSVYRKTGLMLADSNHDGVADDYGQCYAPGTEVRATSDPSQPQAGQTQYYLVTGRNQNGEGSMGYASNRHERPDLSPCP